MASPTKNEHVFQAPTGTRDFYPSDLNRLRYVQDAWRRTSINHGFDEIDGPTFEHLDLYTAKSGEGIVSELFSFERFGGEKKFALRPEFTPTLARMYASKAGSLPKPTKWFWMENCYRAERPQRGRLREFCQWNCDLIGDESVEADVEIISTCISCLAKFGLTPNDVRIRLNDRRSLVQTLTLMEVPPGSIEAAIQLVDEAAKLSAAAYEAKALTLGMPAGWAKCSLEYFQHKKSASSTYERTAPGTYEKYGTVDLTAFHDALTQAGLLEWCDYTPGLARGLAYYTGMVFEVHEVSGAERAIAGGGRYDKLIEMFGGPPTPAVGFGMGDVVLSLVLQDKGLMPSDDQIARDLGLSPHVFVFAAENKENPEITKAADGVVVSVLAEFRRAGLHARRSYKSTRNIGKLLGDATKAGSRFALIVETGTMGQIKDLKSGEQTAVDLREVVAWVRGRVGV